MTRKRSLSGRQEKNNVAGDAGAESGVPSSRLEASSPAPSIPMRTLFMIQLWGLFKPKDRIDRKANPLEGDSK